MNLSEKRALKVVYCCLFLFAVVFPISAEEGMWTFDNPPLKIFREKYGFEPQPEWFDHVRLSSVRIGDGGSGSFISPTGLVLTNHHVAVGQLQKVSAAGKDLVKLGFFAKTPQEELKCPDLEINVLQSMENVTEQVQRSLCATMSSQENFEARKAAIAKIEKESTDSTGLRSDVVTLYQGGEYWLYKYKKFKDIRLVFAPEKQMAFFGGDSDNFTFPRYNLDMAILRVYENDNPETHTPSMAFSGNTPPRGDKPFASTHFLKVQSAGVKAGDLVIVTGHPGTTKRLNTMSQLEFNRDIGLPTEIETQRLLLSAAKTYSEKGPEEARQAQSLIFAVANRLKARGGELRCLQNPETMKAKSEDEMKFRVLAASNPEWEKAYGSAWSEIAAAMEKLKPDFKRMIFLSLPGFHLGGLALQIVQFVTEIKKPDGQRLEGFHDSQLDSLRFKLLSPAPLYLPLEKAIFLEQLKHASQELGPNDPCIKVVLDGVSPEHLAEKIVAETSLINPDERKKLLEGGEGAVRNSQDPLIMLARKFDPFIREMIALEEKNCQSVVKAAGEKIGKARFAAFGKTLYPDATFSLRFTFGTVKGYSENGTLVPPFTTFHGMLDRGIGFGYAHPFDLPKSFVEAKDKMNLAVPFNFISTCDVTGGNSGSPVVNRAGEFVGLIFDGNIHSLGGKYVYDENLNRALAVNSSAIIEALKNQYHAEAVLKEILGNP